MSIINLTPAQLRQAADLKERIARLTKELTAIVGGSATPASVTPTKPIVAKKGGMSAAGKAKIAAAQKLRWAKVKAAKAKATPVAKPAAKPVAATSKAAAKVVKPKRVISPAARAKMAAAAKAMWAAKRAKK
jgi:hypothetical protein